MFRLFPCIKNYLLFIVDKFATFCVIFLTEVKKETKKKTGWSLDFLPQHKVSCFF